MEISTSVNTSQSLALAAYTSQQERQEVSRTRERERSPEASEAGNTTSTKRSDAVNFSSEALRLSMQPVPDNTYGKVKQASESEATGSTRQQEQQAVAPEVRRAEAAKSIAQAISAYRDTSII